MFLASKHTCKERDTTFYIPSSLLVKSISVITFGTCKLQRKIGLGNNSDSLIGMQSRCNFEWSLRYHEGDGGKNVA